MEMPREMIKPIVRFYIQEVKLNLQDRRKLKTFLVNLFRSEQMLLTSLTYIFCSDEVLLKINQDFLEHDEFTDIITFDLSEDKNIVGEIYISVDRIRENASTHRASFYDELHRVIFHGALHLCGFTDKRLEAKKVMTSKEDQYLLAWHNVPRGT